MFQVEPIKMQQLKDELSKLVEAIPRGAPVVYCDIPLHLNVGDLLINAGAESLFRRFKVNVTHRFSVHDMRYGAGKIHEEHVIVLHGGGNFGDIWPAHEELRRTVVGKFKKNKIIVFPQSVHYDNHAEAMKTAASFRDHRDLTIFVRDRESLQFVTGVMGLAAQMCPDTAHHLWKDGPLWSPSSGTGLLRFMRRDREVSTPDTTAHDWNDLKRIDDRAFYRLYQVLSGTLGGTPVQDALVKGWYQRRDAIIERSVEFFKKFEIVETSRLHGVILSALLEKTIVASDNRYGKISRYADAWLS